MKEVFKFEIYYPQTTYLNGKPILVVNAHQVDALLVVGEFAVHKSLGKYDDGYTLTHLPSRLKVIDHGKLNELKRLCRRLGDMKSGIKFDSPDFSRDNAEVVKYVDGLSVRNCIRYIVAHEELEFVYRWLRVRVPSNRFIASAGKVYKEWGVEVGLTSE
jgi:hypothetical protein